MSWAKTTRVKHLQQIKEEESNNILQREHTRKLKMAYTNCSATRIVLHTPQQV